MDKSNQKEYRPKDCTFNSTGVCNCKKPVRDSQMASEVSKQTTEVIKKKA